MSNFISGLKSDIDAMLDYREALGYSRKSYEARLKSLDRFCAAVCPEADILTREIVTGWKNSTAASRKKLPQSVCSETI